MRNSRAWFSCCRDVEVFDRRGALLLRKDPPNNYVFINDNVFENALAELQIAIRQGFYFADEEVKTE